MTDEEIRASRDLRTASYALREIADECLARGRRIAELEECRRLLKNLADSSCHDNCAISREYAPPDTKCNCGLDEAKEFLEKYP